jgi:predicted lipid-binding transport protein (Tim44 family)
MTKPTTHKAPAAKTPAARPAAGPLGRWLADLGFGYFVMLCASIGGLVWLAAIHLIGIRHDAALILSLLAGVGAFARAHQLAARAAASARADTETDTESEVNR